MCEDPPGITPEQFWTGEQYFLCICEYSLTTPWCLSRHCPRLRDTVKLERRQSQILTCVRRLVVRRCPGWEGRKGLIGVELVEIQRGRPGVGLAGPRGRRGRQTLLPTQTEDIPRPGLSHEVRQTDRTRLHLLPDPVDGIISRLRGGPGGGGGRSLPGRAVVNIPQLLVLHLPLHLGWLGRPF